MPATGQSGQASRTVPAETRLPHELWALDLDGRPQRHERLLDGPHGLGHVRMLIQGHIVWQGAHPIADGAQKVNFIADTAYAVMPLAQGFADAMNHVASQGYDQWEVNHAQSVLHKAFAPFGLAEGQTFAEYEMRPVTSVMATSIGDSRSCRISSRGKSV